MTARDWLFGFFNHRFSIACDVVQGRPSESLVLFPRRRNSFRIKSPGIFLPLCSWVIRVEFWGRNQACSAKSLPRRLTRAMLSLFLNITWFTGDFLSGARRVRVKQQQARLLQTKAVALSLPLIIPKTRLSGVAHTHEDYCKSRGTPYSSTKRMPFLNAKLTLTPASPNTGYQTSGEMNQFFNVIAGVGSDSYLADSQLPLFGNFYSIKRQKLSLLSLPHIWEVSRRTNRQKRIEM